MKNEELEEKIRSLPASLRNEVHHYIDYLVAQQKNEIQSENNFSFNWEGGLSELKTQFNSVDLQHEATRWR